MTHSAPQSPGEGHEITVALSPLSGDVFTPEAAASLVGQQSRLVDYSGGKSAPDAVLVRHAEVVDGDLRLTLAVSAETYGRLKHIDGRNLHLEGRGLYSIGLDPEGVS